MWRMRLIFLLIFLLCACSDRVMLSTFTPINSPPSPHSPMTMRNSTEIQLPTSTIIALPTKFVPAAKLTSTRPPTALTIDTRAFLMCSPIEGFLIKDLPKITSVGYHPPPKGQDDRHEGVDFCFYQWKDLGPIEGKNIQSVLPGRVAAALEETFPYGNFVIIETPGDLIPRDLRETLNMNIEESLYTLYAHLQDLSLKVELDEEVTNCQTLGAVGRTGNTYAPHLHFETRIGLSGARFTGMSNFTDFATMEERKNYRIWRISGLYNHFDPMILLSWGFVSSSQ